MTDEYEPVRFRFNDLLTELEAFGRLARDFIAPEAGHVIYRAHEELAQIQRFAGGSTRNWQIPVDAPLVSVVSKGEYERNGTGARRLVVKGSFIWTIQPLGSHSSKVLRQREFAVVGKASTLIRVCDVELDSEPEIARWRMELGAEDHPGCQFHVQIAGHSENPPFPVDPPIPRFANVLISPTGAMEFALGEIFQERWPRHLSERANQASLHRWGAAQERYLKSMLGWLLGVVGAKGGSPWIRMKRAQPHGEMFLPS